MKQTVVKLHPLTHDELVNVLMREHTYAKTLSYLVYELSDPDYFVDDIREVSASGWP